MSYKATLQHVVVSSSIGVKYIAATEVVKEVMLLKELAEELGFHQQVMHVHCDNTSFIHFYRNP